MASLKRLLFVCCTCVCTMLLINLCANVFKFSSYMPLAPGQIIVKKMTLERGNVDDDGKAKDKKQTVDVNLDNKEDRQVDGRRENFKDQEQFYEKTGNSILAYMKGSLPLSKIDEPHVCVSTLYVFCSEQEVKERYAIPNGETTTRGATGRGSRVDDGFGRIRRKLDTGQSISITLPYIQDWLEGYMKNTPRCPVNRCDFHLGNATKDTDVFMVGAVLLKDKTLPTQRWPGQLYVVYADESAAHYRSDISQENSTWRHAFNLTVIHRSDADLHYPYGRLLYSPLSADQKPDYYELARKKNESIVWFVSHCETQSKRELYVKEMQCVSPEICKHYDHWPVWRCRPDLPTPRPWSMHARHLQRLPVLPVLRELHLPRVRDREGVQGVPPGDRHYPSGQERVRLFQATPSQHVYRRRLVSDAERTGSVFEGVGPRSEDVLADVGAQVYVQDTAEVPRIM